MEETEEKSYIYKGQTLKGYFLPSNPLIISLIGIFTALTYVVTAFIQIPIPATGGVLNVGDLMVMFTALLFGPIVGGISGGVGPMIFDIFSPYSIYAPATLVIKGIEGFLIGFISNPKNKSSRISYRDLFAVVIGGLLIPIGYFIFEAYILNYGVSVALVEVPGNFFQFGFAAITSILLITASRKNIIDSLPQVFNKIFISEEP